MAKNIHEEDALGKAYDARLMRRLLPYLRPSLALAISTFGLVLLMVGVELVRPLLVRAAIDGPISILANEQTPKAWEELHLLCMAIIAVLGVELFLRYFTDYNLMKIGQRVVFALRSHLYRHLQTLPLAFYDRNPVGRLVTRTTGDVEAIGELFSSGLVTMARDILKIVFILAMMLIINWQLALVMIAFFPVMIGVTIWFRNRARKAYRTMRVKLAALNAFLNEALGGIAVTRIFAQEKRQEERYRKRNEEHRQAAMATVMNFSLFFPAVNFVASLAAGVLLWYGSKLVLDHSLTPGTFVVFFFFTDMLFGPLRELSERYAILQNAMAAAERLTKLLDEPDVLPDAANARAVEPKAWRGEIEFRDVWFAYRTLESGEPEWVLRGVSFKLSPGQSLALVGATGSGKTTIVSLICRFYDVQKGQVLIDGVDVREYRKQDLRAAIAVVLQDVFLFAGSVLENLRLGNESISREQVIGAARAAGADSFISRLDGGFDAQVAERGATFSTGQKQLIAVARALAYDPRILMLDEATANIDSETEALLQQGLDKLMTGRTSVAVAHRLSTIRKANLILVLHKGEVVERGTHEELLALEGRYYKLYKLQFEDEGAAVRM